MTSYRVTWEIDIEANTVMEAAKEARQIQLDWESEALFFEVAEPDGGQVWDVDLGTGQVGFKEGVQTD